MYNIYKVDEGDEMVNVITIQIMTAVFYTLLYIRVATKQKTPRVKLPVLYLEHMCRPSVTIDHITSMF